MELTLLHTGAHSGMSAYSVTQIKAAFKIWVFTYFQTEVPFSQFSHFTFGNQSYPSK